MEARLWIVAPAVLLLLGSCDQPPPEPTNGEIPYRTDLAPEEFGIGRPHTRNAACKREIDEHLEQIRNCYNGGSDSDCAALQRTHSAQIARLKNSQKCRQ